MAEDKFLSKVLKHGKDMLVQEGMAAADSPQADMRQVGMPPAGKPKTDKEQAGMGPGKLDLRQSMCSSSKGNAAAAEHRMK